MITGDELALLIPQQDEMRMLDAIVRVDDQTIVCHSRRHLDADNPLRANGRLSIMTTIEFAAQAMAAHHRLTARHESASQGMLVSVRQCTFARARLDKCVSPLMIEVTRMAATGDALTYRFDVSANGAAIAEGRASVALAGNAK